MRPYETTWTDAESRLDQYGSGTPPPYDLGGTLSMVLDLLSLATDEDWPSALKLAGGATTMWPGYDAVQATNATLGSTWCPARSLGLGRPAACKENIDVHAIAATSTEMCALLAERAAYGPHELEVVRPRRGGSCAMLWRRNVEAGAVDVPPSHGWMATGPGSLLLAAALNGTGPGGVRPLLTCGEGRLALAACGGRATRSALSRTAALQTLAASSPRAVLACDVTLALGATEPMRATLPNGGPLAASGSGGLRLRAGG